MDLLDLNGQARVLLLDCLADWVVPGLVLLELVPHQIVPVLNRSLYLVLLRPNEVELHDGVVFELTLPDQFQLALCLWKNGEDGHVVVVGDQPLKVFDNEVRVLPKLDAKVLIGLDPLELPVGTLKYEIEVDLCVTCQFNLEVLGNPMLVLDKDLYP